MITRRIAEVSTALVTGVPVGKGVFGDFHSLLEADRSYRSSERFQRDRQYWLDRFRDNPLPVSLASRAANSNYGSERVLRRTAYISRSSTTQLRELKARRGWNLPQILTAALAAYLSRWTGGRDLLIGLPVTGRLGDIARRTPGMMSNVLPLRLLVHPGMRCSELIERVMTEINRS